MELYFEKVIMPDEGLRIRSGVSSASEHMIEVHPHWHNEVEILFFINGYAKQQVDDHIFIAEPGDIVIISSDQIHSTYSYQESKCDILVVMFDAANLFGNQANQVSTQSYGNTVHFKNPIKTSEDLGKCLLESINQINKELIEKKDSYAGMIMSYLFKLTSLLKRYNLYEIHSKNEKNVNIIKQTLQKTFTLIDKNYAEDISLVLAAAASNLSIPHFCRLFKKATGMTFTDYLNFYRVLHAEKLLSSSKTITDISLECGFGSTSSFIRSFKKYKHCTPSSFRRF